MNGLFLQGGGAKGAFQAGAIAGLIEKNLKFNVIAGTSIGAINGGFIFYDKASILESVWIDEDSFNLSDIKKDDIVIDTEKAIDLLRVKINKEDSIDKNVKFFVNYAKVENGNISERYVDISNKTNEEIFKYMRFSSLLPKRRGIKISENTYKTKDAIENFKDDVENGIYDGMRLDGGILNNVFLEPFIENKVDKIYMIVFKNNFEVPKYILENYHMDQLVIISSDYDYKETDTLNFSKEFLKENFKKGYNKVVNL